MLDFMEFCLSHNGPVKILDNDCDLDNFNHEFIVQNLFPERCNNYTSLISTSVVPSALNAGLGQQLTEIEKNLKFEL